MVKDGVCTCSTSHQACHSQPHAFQAFCMAPTVGATSCVLPCAPSSLTVKCMHMPPTHTIVQLLCCMLVCCRTNTAQEALRAVLYPSTCQGSRPSASLPACAVGTRAGRRRSHAACHHITTARAGRAEVVSTAPASAVHRLHLRRRHRGSTVLLRRCSCRGAALVSCWCHAALRPDRPCSTASDG